MRNDKARVGQNEQMKETEVKFRVKNFGGIVKKLKKMGAVLDWRGLEASYYFDTPDNKLKTKKQNLRLRKWSGHSNTLTLKIPPRKNHKKYKVQNEYQIEINNIKTAADILKNLGFVECLRYKKYRQHWKIKGASIELDAMDGRRFVEIEASENKINELAEVFNLDWNLATTKSYVSILRRKPARRV